MNRFFVSAGLILFFWVSAAAGQASLPLTRKEQRIAAEIRRLYEAQSEGLVKGDLRLLERNFADDFVVTNPSNLFLNKQQVLESVRSGRLAFSTYERKIEYLRVYGDTVVVAGRESGMSRGQTPPAGQMLHLRFTGISRKHKGIWQQIVRHASVITPSP